MQAALLKCKSDFLQNIKFRSNFGSQSRRKIKGPSRIFPGGIHVTRAFGNVCSKLERHSGNPKVLIATPSIKKFKISRDYDFILMATDGICSKLDDEKVLKIIWETSKRQFYAREQPIYPLVAACVE